MIVLGNFKFWSTIAVHRCLSCEVSQRGGQLVGTSTEKCWSPMQNVAGISNRCYEWRYRRSPITRHAYYLRSSFEGEKRDLRRYQGRKVPSTFVGTFVPASKIPWLVPSFVCRYDMIFNILIIHTHIIISWFSLLFGTALPILLCTEITCKNIWGCLRNNLPLFIQIIWLFH